MANNNFWYFTFDETRMKAEAVQPVPYKYKDRQKLMKLISEFLRNMIKGIINDPISKYQTSLQDMGKYPNNSIISLLNSNYSLTSVPLTWELNGGDEIKNVRIMNCEYYSIGSSIDLLFNNWFGQTIRSYFSCEKFDLSCLVRQIQLQYGIHDDDVKPLDILRAMTYAYVNDGNNMNMRWLKKFVSETNNLDMINQLFHGINHADMAVEYTELKAMCMKRLNERNESDGIVL